MIHRHGRLAPKMFKVKTIFWMLEDTFELILLIRHIRQQVLYGDLLLPPVNQQTVIHTLILKSFVAILLIPEVH